VEVREQEQRQAEVHRTPRGIEQAHAEQQQDAREIDWMSDKTEWPVGDGRGRIPSLAFAAREGCRAPEMERQAGEHDDSAQPTEGIRADRQEARSVGFLEVRVPHGRPQPNDGASRGVDPELWSHSRSLAYVGARCCSTRIDVDKTFVCTGSADKQGLDCSRIDGLVTNGGRAW
jgi:hypothetical protein